MVRCPKCKSKALSTGRNCQNRTCSDSKCHMHRGKSKQLLLKKPETVRSTERLSPAAAATDMNDNNIYTNVKVGKSTIPNAGKGLFTIDPIKRNTRIGLYTGKVVQPGVNGPYVMQCQRRRRSSSSNKPAGMIQVDAGDENGVMSNKLRYMNDGMMRVGEVKNRRKNNVKIGGAHSEIDGCVITSTKNIPAGSELFLSYGKYYLVHDKNVKRKYTKK